MSEDYHKLKKQKDDILARQKTIKVTTEIIRRLKRAVRTNEKAALFAKELGSPKAEAYAQGSAFGFNQALRIIIGAE